MTACTASASSYNDRFLALLMSSKGANSTTCILYVITGITTAIPVAYAVMTAGSTYGPISVWEYVSLAGSAVLLLSGLICRESRILAAWTALCGAVAVWSFYGPTIYAVTEMRLTDQQINLLVLRRSSPELPLSIEQPSAIMSIPQSVVAQARSIGLSGHLTFEERSQYGKGKLSHVTIVLEKPVTAKIRLPEPDATDIMYVQYGSEFKMYPPDARTIDRKVDLQPMWDDPKQTEVMVELSSGARSGFGVVFNKQGASESGK